MDSLNRGLVFFQQAYRLARKYPRLIEPSVYGWIAGLGMTLIGLAPIVLTILLLGSTGLSQFIVAFIGMLILCIQWLISYLFSAVTAVMADDILTTGTLDAKRAWAVLREDWIDLLSLGVASPMLTFVSALRGRRRRNPVGGQLGQALGAPWSDAPYLIQPVMVVENLGLKDSLKRTTEIVRQNLLMVSETVIGVGPANMILGLGLTVSGLALGVMAGLAIHGAWGVAAGLLITSLFTLLSMAVTAYMRTVYHTSLYVWVLQEEHRREEASLQPAMPPDILAAALEGLSSLAAPLYYEQ